MAANPITLTIGIISLTTIPFTLTGRTNTAVLTTGDVKIKKLNTGTLAFDDFSAFTIPDAAALGGTITLNPALEEGDLLLIQINDGAQISDRVSVDFSEAYAGHDAVVPFAVPDEAGTYKLNVQTVNEDDFSAVTASREFVVGKDPKAANSSIALDYKPYLVKYVGTKHNVKVALNNATNDAAEGNYEVIFKATKQ